MVNICNANKAAKFIRNSEIFVSLHPDRFGGGIGRHAGLKIPWAAMPVRVRFPSEAHQSLLEEILRGIFVLCYQKNPVARPVVMVLIQGADGDDRASNSPNNFTLKLLSVIMLKLIPPEMFTPPF